MRYHLRDAKRFYATSVLGAVGGPALMTYVRAGGHRLEYKWVYPKPTRTAEQGPTLVFLHEGLGSVALWKDFPERVVQATNCAALVYSRYGHGKSDPLTEPRTVDYMHKEALETLPELLDTLSIRSPILIGHSDGASIALIYAGSGAAGALALVLIAPHVFVEEPTVVNIRKAREAFETTEMKAKLARYHADPSNTFWGWNNIWLDRAFSEWNIEDYLPDVRCPLLVVQCKDDAYGTLAQVDAIGRKVGGALSMRILSKGGHSPHLRRKQTTVRTVAQFVRRIRRQC